MANYLVYNGETHTLVEWAKKVGMSHQALQRRVVTYGWTLERALTTPIGNYTKKVTVAAQPDLTTILKRIEREHRAAERVLVNALQAYIRSAVQHHAAMMTSIDMSSLGQPPAGSFTTRGQSVTFRKGALDRELPSVQALSQMEKSR